MPWLRWFPPKEWCWVLNIDIATIVRYARNLGVSLVLVACPVVMAQDPPETALPDVRLVIDISGSMKQNDPDNLRQPAVELLLQLLPGEARAGIWTFGGQVNMLVPHKPVTQEWRREAARLATGIQSVGLHTNIGGALEKAAYDVDRVNSRYRTSIILLTDGMVDIDDQNPEVNDAERRRIVEQVLPDITRAGYRIHTIALSDNADRSLLDELSTATDGIAATAHSAEELMRIFLRAFDAAAPSEQVPLRNNRFVVDSSINEFTALIFREVRDESITLIGPDEKIYFSDSTSGDIKWYRADNYDLITVKNPLAGEWQIGGSQNSPASENRVTIISNLNLRVAPMPHNLAVGDQSELIFQLEEKGKTVTRAEFLSLLSVNAELELLDGETRRSVWKKNPLLDSPPADGIYTVPLPPFESDGLHTFTLLIDGKSFTRKYTHDFIIRPQIKSEPAVATEESPAVAEVFEPEPEREKPEITPPKVPNVAKVPKETVAEDSPEPAPGISAWLVYGMIALVNVAVFAGAFFAYRYIMNDGKKPVRGKNSDQSARDNNTPQDQDNDKAVVASGSDEKQKPDEAEDEDEEPPMDDLDSALDELSQLPEFADKKAASSKEDPDKESGTELDDLDLMSMDDKTRTSDNSDTDEKK